MSFAFQHFAAATHGGTCRSALRPSLTVPARHGWWVRMLLLLLPVWCVLTLGAGSASAMAMTASGPDVPAPMCDPDGASVAAGDEIPEVDRGHFESLPCEAQLLLASWRADAPEPGCKAVACNDADPSAPLHPTPPRFRYEGAREFSVPFPAHTDWVPAVFSDGEGLAPSLGHERTPFRPPVTLA